MTDWDARAEKLAKERAAAAERSRQQWEAEARARRERVDAIRNKLADIAGWAIKRYQGARVAPLPVYVEWEDRVESFFSVRMVRRRSQIGEVYPLIKGYTEYDPEGGGTVRIWSMIVATADRQIYTADLGRRNGDPRVAEIVIHREKGSSSAGLEQYLKQYPSDSPSFLSSYAIDAQCDAIASYVADKVSQDTPPEYF